METEFVIGRYSGDHSQRCPPLGTRPVVLTALQFPDPASIDVVASKVAAREEPVEGLVHGIGHLMSGHRLPWMAW
ncbi:hypothetical protein [Krasilnikovia sp. M28-CT-15]|uniref:hypothetical protein n=1 Tax=Krasilnikovia sp. M28-CT-15 TaxID=3373540 RepID=UPI00399CB5D6